MPKPQSTDGLERSYQRLMRRAEDLVTDGDMDDVMLMFREALKAKTRVRSADRRNYGDPIKYEDIPFWAVRLAAGKFMYEARMGKALTRVDVNHNDVRTREQARRDVLKIITGQKEQLVQLEETWRKAIKSPETIEIPQVPVIELVEEKS